MPARALRADGADRHAGAEQVEERVVLDVTGGHDHQAPRHVVALVEPPHLVTGGGGDALHRPQDGPAEWVVGPQRLVQQVVDQVVGRVLVHVDLFQDHLALGLEVRSADHRVLEHVGEVVDGHGEVAVPHPGVEARVLLGGERVDVAAHRVEGLGDVAGGSGLRPLEQQVLQEMGRAADRRRLVPRSRQHPEPQGHRPDAGDAFGHDSQARLELGPADGHGREPSARAGPGARGPWAAGRGRDRPASRRPAAPGGDAPRLPCPRGSPTPPPPASG